MVPWSCTLIRLFQTWQLPLSFYPKISVSESNDRLSSMDNAQEPSELQEGKRKTGVTLLLTTSQTGVERQHS